MATRSRTAVQVRRTRRKDGSATETYSVRWTDPSGARRRRTFREREHAEALAARIDYLAYRDELGELVAGDATVASFVPDWEADARSRIAESTVDSYVSLWVRLLAPRFGRVPLRRVTARDIAAHKRRMLADGVGAETARRALVVLQSIFALAVEWDEVSVNPVKSVRKPKGQPIGAAKPVAPPVVEAMRAAFLDRGDLRSATMISLLAYAGPRPGEMLALRVSDIRARTLLIERAVAGGKIKRVKTGRLYRTVYLLPPLRDDLEAYIAAAALKATDLLFRDRETGGV